MDVMMNISSNTFSRRKIMGSAAIAGLASTILKKSFANDQGNTPKIHLKKGDTILFQGDSITDAGRDKKNQVPNQQKAFGRGYSWMAASKLLVSNPELELSLYNRGISGNKVHQLASRWDKDCLSLKPDVLSILIGVNDIWHGLNGKYDGTVQTYEDDFLKLMESTRKALPDTKFIICEPFVLKCGAVNDKWFPEFDKYRASAKKVATQSGAIFIPFQSMFDQAINFASPNHWAGDGVHPSAHGASLMAHFWLESIRS
jgi:lysophospholipase L1-like esterase